MNSYPPPIPEGGLQYLRRALRELPTQEPDAAGWDAIAAQLDAEQAIARALPQLPSHEPADDTWARLAERLDQLVAPAPVVVRPLWQRRPWQLSVGLAATVLLLLVVGQQWFRKTKIAKTPQVAVVALPPPMVPALPALPLLATDPLEEQGEAFIDAHCTSLPTVCQSVEFKQLRAQLTLLQQQEQQLRDQTQLQGATPQLVRQQVQVTIRKATVTRELIHLLIS